MDGLHSVLRQIRGETKSRRDHMTVFREFLSQLERASRKPRPPEKPRRARSLRRAAR